MPIYEYTCLDCQAEVELIRSIKDADAPLKCNQCQGENTKRKISLFNASSGGRTIAGGSSCSTCTSTNCGSCGVR